MTKKKKWLIHFQEWCEGLAEIIWLNRQQIKEAERLRAKFPIMQANNTDHVPALNTQITQLLSSLVTRLVFVFIGLLQIMHIT